ncbi:MAG: imidazole glycerol phosphate synthase subunit HisH [Alphaproteobacteria bacterium]|nr:imidazole glycerol phosphate synthase subunit HisH [Alphaproteobacteria bacterium]
MDVAIIDYGSGNLRSAAKAIERAARESDAGATIRVTDDPRAIAAADRIVLPGVGAFADCRAGLLARPGVVEAMTEAVQRRGRPFLGICVGMQLLASRGIEFGTHEGLDWIAGEVRRIEPVDPAIKVPHMGWNTLAIERGHALLAGIAPGAHAYFVHSYHFVPAPGQESCVIATTEYAGTVVAALARRNVAGTQFHPEKSQETGLRLLANFLRWSP